jgi:hypothetical protein
MGENFCLRMGCDFEEVGGRKPSRKKFYRPEILLVSFQLYALAEYTFNTKRNGLYKNTHNTEWPGSQLT